MDGKAKDRLPHRVQELLGLGVLQRDLPVMYGGWFLVGFCLVPELSFRAAATQVHIDAVTTL
jgi:hypothetical protein